MEEVNFEKEMKRLENIVNKMQDKETSLDDSIKLYEEGNKIILLLQEALKAAEAKVETIVDTKSK